MESMEEISFCRSSNQVTSGHDSLRPFVLPSAPPKIPRCSLMPDAFLIVNLPKDGLRGHRLLVLARQPWLSPITIGPRHS